MHLRNQETIRNGGQSQRLHATCSVPSHHIAATSLSFDGSLCPPCFDCFGSVNNCVQPVLQFLFRNMFAGNRPAGNAKQSQIPGGNDCGKIDSWDMWEKEGVLPVSLAAQQLCMLFYLGHVASDFHSFHTTCTGAVQAAVEVVTAATAVTPSACAITKHF